MLMMRACVMVKYVALLMVVVLAACSTSIKSSSETANLKDSHWAELGNNEWQLIAWQDKELIEKDISITLQYQEGRISGLAACNRYFASVKVDEQAGGIVLGAVGSTMMACLDSQMQAESRFLALLAKITHYQITDNHLYLSYQENDQVINVLTFQKVVAKKL